MQLVTKAGTVVGRCSGLFAELWGHVAAAPGPFKKLSNMHKCGGLLAENTSLQLKPVAPFFWFFIGTIVGTEQTAANLRQFSVSFTESITYDSGNTIKGLRQAYGGYNEIAAAGQLYNLTIEVVVAGTDFPPPPVPPAPNTLHVLHHPHSCHYSVCSHLPIVCPRRGLILAFFFKFVCHFLFFLVVRPHVVWPH